MRLICFWCFLVVVVRSQDPGYFAPQTFRQNVDPHSSKSLFSPAGEAAAQSHSQDTWKAKQDSWSGPAHQNTQGPLSKPEPWRPPYAMSKEQQAAILHHKQALTSEGSFRFEYASDNGLSAGEVIEPDGSRVGAYQYKDPSGQLVKLKYKAGKDGFQILEGSHIPKSPQPVPPLNQENHHIQAYEQQRQQYELQQHYNQQRLDPKQHWSQSQNTEGGQLQGAGGQYFLQNWRPGAPGPIDDGQYRENEVIDKGPHSFGEGYSFAFQG